MAYRSATTIRHDRRIDRFVRILEREGAKLGADLIEYSVEVENQDDYVRDPANVVPVYVITAYHNLEDAPRRPQADWQWRLSGKLSGTAYHTGMTEIVSEEAYLPGQVCSMTGKRPSHWKAKGGFRVKLWHKEDERQRNAGSLWNVAA